MEVAEDEQPSSRLVNGGIVFTVGHMANLAAGYHRETAEIPRVRLGAQRLKDWKSGLGG